MSENIKVEEIVRNALAESKRLEKEYKTKEDESERKRKEGEKPEEKEETFNCPECGENVRANQKFCNACGIELEWEE